MNNDEHGESTEIQPGKNWGNRWQFEVVKLRPKAEIGVDDEKEALRQYAEKFGECRDGTKAGLGLFLLSR